MPIQKIQVNEISLALDRCWFEVLGEFGHDY